MIKFKAIKKEFGREGLKIGNSAIKRFIKLEEAKIMEDIKKTVRKANILGKKVIQEKDLTSLT
jgi:hypothetical protein